MPATSCSRRMVDALAEMHPAIPVCLHQDHGNDEATCLSRDPPRLHLRDDGRLAPGRRQDPGRLRLQRRDHRAASPRWRTPSAPRSRASSACLGSLETGQATPRTATARKARSRHDQLLTDPDEAVDFVAAHQASTRWPSPCGTSHGAYKFSAQPRRRHPRHARHRGDPRQRCPTPTSSCTAPPRCRRSCRTSSTRHGGEMPQTWGVPVEEIVARHPPRRAQGQHRHRLPAGDGRPVPQRRRREAAASSTRASSSSRRWTRCATLCRERFEAFGTAGHASKHQGRPRSTRWPAATPAGALDPQIAGATRPLDRSRKEHADEHADDGTDAKTLTGKDRYEAGVLRVPEDGLLGARLRAEGHRPHRAVPHHAAGRRRPGRGGRGGRRRKLHRDLDRGLDRPADRREQYRAKAYRVDPVPNAAGPVLRLHRLRPRPLRAGLHRQPHRLDHRQRLRLQAAQGAAPRGHAPPGRLREDLPGPARPASSSSASGSTSSAGRCSAPRPSRSSASRAATTAASSTRR